MKLWSGILSPFSAKVRIALAEKQLAYETLQMPWSRKTLWGRSRRSSSPSARAARSRC